MMGNIDAEAVQNKARWVRVSTAILDHELFRGKELCEAAAWLWLVTNAAWKPRRVRHKGKLVELQRGQLLAGRAFLAERFGWSEQKLRTWLKLLVTENMVEINQSNGHYANVITICNYDKYQSVDSAKGQSNNQSVTSSQPEPNQTLTRDTKLTNTADGARERKIDTSELYDKLVEAANGSLHPLAVGMGLMAVSDPIGWIRGGADIDLDILPAVREVGHKALKGSVQSWRYFAPKVAENKARRERGLPEVTLQPPRPIYEDFKAKRTREATEALEVVRSMS